MRADLRHSRSLAIAILGTRGIPSCYSGFETFAEQLSGRLAARGHRVTVYRRTRYARGDVPGVEIITLPAIYTKYLETASHTFLSVLDCMRRGPDVALVCNAANAALLPLLVSAGIPTAINVDGIEWKRRKWSVVGREVHRLSEHLAVASATTIVTDARAIQDYYADRHGIRTVFIPYGGDLPAPASTAFLARHGLRAGRYDLCVCRFEPENNPLVVVRAHDRLETSIPLVMVGDAPYARRYVAAVRQAAGREVLFLGFRFGDEYRQLLFHARAAIHAAEVGGTHPVVLEAMGAGKLVIYNNTPENREVVGSAGLPFGGSVEDLSAVWRRLDSEPALPGRYGPAAAARVQSHYLWERVTDQYETLLTELAGT